MASRLCTTVNAVSPYIYLWHMALDVLSMPASKAYAERVFTVYWQEKQAVKEYGALSVHKDEQ